MLVVEIVTTPRRQVFRMLAFFVFAAFTTRRELHERASLRPVGLGLASYPHPRLAWICGTRCTAERAIGGSFVVVWHSNSRMVTAPTSPLRGFGMPALMGCSYFRELQRLQNWAPTHWKHKGGNCTGVSLMDGPKYRNNIPIMTHGRRHSLPIILFHFSAGSSGSQYEGLPSSNCPQDGQPGGRHRATRKARENRNEDDVYFPFVAI